MHPSMLQTRVSIPGSTPPPCCIHRVHVYAEQSASTDARVLLLRQIIPGTPAIRAATHCWRSASSASFPSTWHAVSLLHRRRYGSQYLCLDAYIMDSQLRRSCGYGVQQPFLTANRSQRSCSSRSAAIWQWQVLRQQGSMCNLWYYQLAMAAQRRPTSVCPMGHGARQHDWWQAWQQAAARQHDN
jgi:hypothetical protein